MKKMYWKYNQIKIFINLITYENNIYKFQKKITDIKSIKALPAHNGFCVYLYEDYISGNYLINNNQNIKQIIPEHIILNKSIHEKTKKFMLVSDSFLLNS